MKIYLFNREENIVGKGENNGYEHFFWELCDEKINKSRELRRR